MLGLLVAAALSNQIAKPVVWYGPVTATFQLQFNGNQYDPAENDVHVHFLGEKAQKEDRIAYFDPRLGAWKAILCTQTPGTFRAELIRNGKVERSKADEGNLDVHTQLPSGFVHPDPQHPNRFVWDDGSPFVPIGFNLGWQNQDLIPMTEEIAKMGAAGVNWTRIWACPWDGKDPWWPQDKVSPLDQLWEPALTKWADMQAACDKARVGMQMVLFNHGLFSSKVNPNWPDNPWNAAKGGFLKDAGDFFTNAEAKRRTKMWLRYAVARYGASPYLFAWELFNEVQWVDARYEDRWADIEAWHKEMADYLRSIDPYHHPVTTSSELRPNLNASLDFLQPHTYPPSVLNAILGANLPKDKAGFFGEFGPSNMETTVARTALRDGLLAGLLANQAASGMFWYWDVVQQKDLYDEFTKGRKIADLSDWGKHPTAHVATLTVETAGRAPLAFGPGLSWAKTTRTSFNLPADANPDALGQLSSYLQGKANTGLSGGPIKFKFTVPKPSSMRLILGEISKGGAALDISIDGHPAVHKVYPSVPASAATLTDRVEFSIPTGPHEVTIQNPGQDWVRIDQVSLTNVAPQAQAEALAETDWMILRVTKSSEANGNVQVAIRGVPLSDGQYDVQSIDLDTGRQSQPTLQPKNFSLSIPMTAHDQVFIFKKKL